MPWDVGGPLRICAGLVFSSRTPGHRFLGATDVDPVAASTAGAAGLVFILAPRATSSTTQLDLAKEERGEAAVL